MDIIAKYLTISDTYVIAAIGILLGILIISIFNMVKVHALSKKYNTFIKSFDGIDMEDSLKRFVDRVDKVYLKNLELENHCNQIDKTLLSCFQKIGVIRYNAFADMGSDLSFAIALLDGNDNGFVINGIYSRETSTTYAKPISNGKSKHTLSEEEIQALDSAKKSFVQRKIEI